MNPKRLPLVMFACVALCGCMAPAAEDALADEQMASPQLPATPYLVVLGTAQDGGYPQAGTKPGDAWTVDERRYATSLAIVDPATGSRWLIEATPDFREQLYELDRIAPVDAVPGLAGVFLTHAHVGHYAGLIHLGREVIGAHGVPVYAMPRMREFLAGNGPWDQLVSLENLVLQPLADGVPVHLTEAISVTPFLVPHRDEYSETVGFRITGPSRTVVFLPDIDKWERWDEWGTSIEEVVAGSDVAYLDGSFFRDGEIPGRSMADIPHPFIVETMTRFEALPDTERRKVRFIHLNRTNRAAFPDSEERHAVEDGGFLIAAALEIVTL